jgi:hypothetical protein
MAKKSHRIASRQAAVGRERKKKKKTQVTDKRPVTSEEHSITAELPADSSIEAQVTTTAPKTGSISPKESSRYTYVFSDLKHIAFIAGPMILLIIILAFII